MDYEGKYAPNDTSKFFTEEVLNNWNELMPCKFPPLAAGSMNQDHVPRMLTRTADGMGFQWVNDTHKYHDLPTPIVWPEKTVFTTSITHQLHCLVRITRRPSILSPPCPPAPLHDLALTFVRAQFAVVQTYSGLKSGHEIPDDHHWHMIHCFAYLRQTIMCSADMALEGLETTFPDHNGGSDGWDSKHGELLCHIHHTSRCSLDDADGAFSQCARIIIRSRNTWRASGRTTIERSSRGSVEHILLFKIKKQIDVGPKSLSIKLLEVQRTTAQHNSH